MNALMKAAPSVMNVAMADGLNSNHDGELAAKNGKGKESTNLFQSRVTNAFVDPSSPPTIPSSSSTSEAAKPVKRGRRAADSLLKLNLRAKHAGKAGGSEVEKTFKNSWKCPPTPGNPRWTVARQPTTKTITPSTPLDDTPTLRPRQWCSSKTELLAILPELSGTKCVNGISWGHSPVPVVLIDEDNGITISEPQDDGSNTTIDVFMVRDFVCRAEDLIRSCIVSEEEIVPSSLVDDSSSTSVPSMSRHTKADGSGTSGTSRSSQITPSVEKKPKKTRRRRREASQNESISNSVESTPHEPSIATKKRKRRALDDASRHHPSSMDAAAAQNANSIPDDQGTSCQVVPTLQSMPSPTLPTIPDNCAAVVTSSEKRKCRRKVTRSKSASSKSLPKLSITIPTTTPSRALHDSELSPLTPLSSSSPLEAVDFSGVIQTEPSVAMQVEAPAFTAPSQPHKQEKPFSVFDLKFNKVKKTGKEEEGRKTTGTPSSPPGNSIETRSHLVQIPKDQPDPGANHSVAYPHQDWVTDSFKAAPKSVVGRNTYSDALAQTERSGQITSSPTPRSLFQPHKQDQSFNSSELKSIIKVKKEQETGRSIETPSCSFPGNSLEGRSPTATKSTVAEEPPVLRSGVQPLQEHTWEEGSEPGEISMIGGPPAIPAFQTNLSLSSAMKNPSSHNHLPSSLQAQSTCDSPEYSAPKLTALSGPFSPDLNSDRVPVCSPPFQAPPLLYHDYSGPSASFFPTNTRWDRTQEYLSQQLADIRETVPEHRAPLEILSRRSPKRLSHDFTDMRNRKMRNPMQCSSAVASSSGEKLMTSLQNAPHPRGNIELAQLRPSPSFSLLSTETRSISSSSPGPMCSTFTPPPSPPLVPLHKVSANFIISDAAESPAKDDYPRDHEGSPDSLLSSTLHSNSVNPIDSSTCTSSELSLPPADGYSSKKLVHKSVELLQHTLLSVAPDNCKDQLIATVEQHERKSGVLPLSRKRKLVESTDLVPLTIHSPSVKTRNTITASGPLHDGQSLDHVLPDMIPPEIQVLTESYIHGTPVLCITSRASLYRFWRTIEGRVPGECKYMYLGFFQVMRVKETRILGSRVPSIKAPGFITGKVSWCFKLKWNAGGEEELSLSPRLQLNHPWWHDVCSWNSAEIVNSEQKDNMNEATVPDTLSLVPAGCLSGSSLASVSEEWYDNGEADSDTESTPFYRKRRKDNPSYPSRHEPLGPRLPSLVWLPLLVVNHVEEDARPEHERNDGTRRLSIRECQAGIGDGGSWKGWYCATCGKLNRQTFFRRRKCSSSFCKDVPIIACSVQELDILRDIGQHLPMVLPINAIPTYIDPLVVDWDNGMRTLVYRVHQDNILSTDQVGQHVKLTQRFDPAAVSSAKVLRDLQVTRKAVVKHIFTCNNPALQEEHTDLLKRVQEEIVLSREETDLRPYFSYTAGVPSTQNSTCFASSFASTTLPPVPWSEVPFSIEQTKDLLEHFGRYYGEPEKGEDAFSINQLVVLAWTVLGRKKGDTVLSAKDHSIIIMCLGHEVAIELQPTSGFSATLDRTPISTERLRLMSKPSNFASKGATVDIIDAMESMTAPSTSNDSMILDINMTATEYCHVESHAEMSRPLSSQDYATSSTDTLFMPDAMHVSATETNFPHLPDILPPAMESTGLTTSAEKLATFEFVVSSPALTGASVQPGSSDDCTPQSKLEDRTEKPVPKSDFDTDGLLMPFTEATVTVPDVVKVKEEQESVRMDTSYPDEHHIKDEEVVEETGIACEMERMGGSSAMRKAPKENMRFTLVHGDALLLSGDDFEYTIQRLGVSLLLVGSNVLQK